MIIGIDLGTTNSAVAVWRDGAAMLVPNALGDVLTPSAVAIGEDGSILTGLAARERMIVDPSTAATLFKRTMGTQVRYKLGRKQYSSEELSSLILRGLAEDVEAHLGERPERAVITVPAYFNDKQRQATRRAGQLAGLEVDRLVNEPTAAALAYGIHELEEERPFLVFDLGGGTFDVSVVEIFDSVIEVRSSAGDNRLGGEDFNGVLADLAFERIGRADLRHSIDSRLAEVVRDAAERARRALTEAEEVEFGFVWKNERHSATISARAFEQAAQPLVERLREPVVRSLRDGGVKVGELSEIVMVGGATRMPLIRGAAKRMFGRCPATRIDPDRAVALGAAIQAALKGRDEALREIRLTDVCPFTLGVDSAEPLPNGGMRTGVFAPIIERNTVVPASRMEVFSTMQHGQRAVEFTIYQGESRMVSENVALGKVRVKVPMRRAGTVQVECRFSYDASGLLEVDVTVPETGTAKQLVIVGDEGMSAEKLAKRRAELSKLKFHPREDGANAAVLARARRSYEAHLGVARARIGDLLSQFEAALDSQDRRTVAEAREEIVAALDELEGERFL